MVSKSCIKCGVELNSDTTTWYRQKNYIHKCNECVKEEKRIAARSIPVDISRARALKALKKLKTLDPVKYTCRQMASSAKKRARALGLDYNIDTKFLISIAPEACPVFNKKLKYGGGEKTKWSPSLDRIDSSKGYTKDNVQIVSNLANLMMNEASLEEIILFSEWAIEKYKGVDK
jgi:hypothetical protein